MQPQIDRIRRALAESEAGASHHYRNVLFHLINPENRESARDRIEHGSIIGKS
jgi:hypothetical protein